MLTPISSIEGYENHCDLRQTAEKIFSSGEITVFLCQALTHAKNVRRVGMSLASTSRYLAPGSERTRK